MSFDLTPRYTLNVKSMPDTKTSLPPTQDYTNTQYMINARIASILHWRLNLNLDAKVNGLKNKGLTQLYRF